MKLSKAWPQSIFVKLPLIFVATGLLMIGLVMGILSYVSHLHDHAWFTRNHNRITYANLLIDRLGTPPDLAKARALAAETGLAMRIEKDGREVFVSGAIPTLPEVEKTQQRCLWEEAKVGVWEGRIFIALPRNGYQYVFSYETASFLGEHPGWAPTALALVLLALFLNYAILRWLFRPLLWLSEGVQRVRNGELAFQIRTQGNDELGDLTKSFNEMTRRIATMIQAKEQLLLDVSHELRSPLTRMKVALELEDPFAKDQIRKNVRVLEAMIAELLESARLDTPQGGLRCLPTDLASLVRRVAAQFKHEAPGVVVQPFTETLVANVDPKGVETALKNLIDNACKYSLHQDRAVEVGLAQQAERLALTVRDFGPGIPEEERELVFEPFYRLDKARVRERGGYGLGLALCKKIMLAHQGEIQVSSSNGAGTVFTLLFQNASA